MKDHLFDLLGSDGNAPLESIFSPSAHLMEEKTMDDQMRRRCGDLICRRTRLLSRFVDDVVEFGELSSGLARLQASVTDLGPLIKSAAGDALKLASQTGVELSLRGSATTPVAVDVPKTERALLALLEKSLADARSGSVVEVETHESDGSVFLLIHYESEGVDESEFNNLFNPFFGEKNQAEWSSAQADRRSLALARAVILRQNGRLSVERVGEALRFTVKFPACEQAPTVAR